MTEQTSQQPVRPGGVSKTFLLGMAVVILAGLVVVGSWMKSRLAQGELPPLSVAERSAMIERETTEGVMLVHPELDFGFDHPGKLFFESEEAEKAMRQQYADPSTQFYAFAEMKTGRLLYVSVSKRPHLDAESFGDMVADVARVFSQKASTRLGENVSVDTRENEVDGERGRAMTHRVLGGGDAHVRVAAWKSTFNRDSEYVVMLIGVTMGSDSLADVISSFRLRAP